ncbi:MAG: hypothetical protein E7381_01230 [Clostridiales bacterium]|nr:hypothetical protein [Clostridiales bacterium]
MNEIQSAEKIKKLTLPFLENGFTFEYFYQKGGDSACVYICRFQKGKNYFDWRENSGGKEINIVVCVNGEFRFPTLKALYPKEYRAFTLKHIFKKATIDERRAWVANILVRELLNGKSEFFGIPL